MLVVFGSNIRCRATRSLVTKSGHHWARMVLEMVPLYKKHYNSSANTHCRAVENMKMAITSPIIIKWTWSTIPTNLRWYMLITSSSECSGACHTSCNRHYRHYHAGYMAIITIMLASAVATDMVCFLVASDTGLVACLELEFSMLPNNSHC